MLFVSIFGNAYCCYVRTIRFPSVMLQPEY